MCFGCSVSGAAKVAFSLLALVLDSCVMVEVLRVGLEFGAEDLGFGFEGSGFRVQGVGFTAVWYLCTHATWFWVRV